MTTQIVMLGQDIVLEVHRSRLHIESSAPEHASRKVQDIRHNAAGVLNINVDNGHAVRVDAFANITDIVLSGTTLVAGQSTIVVAIKAISNLTLSLQNLEYPRDIAPLAARPMVANGVHKLVFWSHSWSAGQHYVVNSLQVA